MRILFFSHYFPPEVNAPASRTYENARRWVGAGHSVTVITSAPNCPDGVVFEGYKNRLSQRETIEGIDVRRVWTYIAPNKGTFRRIANFVSYMVTATIYSLVIRKPDVIIATSPQFFCGWAGVLASFIKRSPFILEIRDLWPESIVAVGAMNNPNIIRFLELLEKIMYRAADHIVTVGAGYRDRLVEKGVQTEDISIVMNGVDNHLFTPRQTNNTLKEKWGLDGSFVCSYIGTLGMACGLDIVLDAARTLKTAGDSGIRFMLVGDGAAREALEHRAKEEGLDNIVFTGRQPREMMPEFLAISDVCLIHLKKTPLFTSVMPSKIFEAAAMEKPVINGVKGFAAEFVSDAGAGINIEPENSGQLIAALMQLKRSPETRREFGQNGREFVTTQYNRDALADDYLDIIAAAVDKSQ